VITEKGEGEQPIYHNCLSLCSQSEGKEWVNTIYISLVLKNYRN